MVQTLHKSANILHVCTQIKNAYQLNANHSIMDSMGYKILEEMLIFYFDLDVAFTLICVATHKW